MGIFSGLKDLFRKDHKTIQDKTEFIATEQSLLRLFTEEMLKEEFAKNGIEEHWGYFKPLLKKELRLFLKSTDGGIKSGTSKIGGQPELPANWDWPKDQNGKSLSFIGQINFAELSEFNFDNIPKNGLLSFFYSGTQEAWGFDPKDKDAFKLVYTREPVNLQRYYFPSDLDEYSIFKETGIEFKESVSLPNWEDERVRAVLNDKEMNAYMDIWENGDLINKFLGHSNNIQGQMELECELVTNGLYLGDTSGYNDPRAEELKKNVNDWTLLLQVDSDHEKTGMMWGDSGRLYFWIRTEDLNKDNFDKAWCILQCY
jgi:uncharacterized protein YwqG